MDCNSIKICKTCLCSPFLCYFCALIVAQNEIMLRIKIRYIYPKELFDALYRYFFICLFIFMMQFLWRYVDELVGKGLEMSVLAQFFFYSALTLIPLSLPLAILLAALMTFGNFGERYELLSMKAAGIPLLRIIRPLIIFVLSCVVPRFIFKMS